MKIRKIFVLMLVFNLIAAVSCEWKPTNKTLVIINALVVLALVMRKAVRRKE